MIFIYKGIFFAPMLLLARIVRFIKMEELPFWRVTKIIWSVDGIRAFPDEVASREQKI
jgi:hypothetical protein